MVSMSSVLFPNRRFTASKSQSASPTGGTIAMKDLEVDEIKSIWRMSPYIYGEETDKSSFGGRHKPKKLTLSATGANQVKSLPSEPNPKHLYNSYDDYLVASLSDAKLGGKANEVDIRERKPVGDKEINLAVDRIQQGRFFLTTRSSAPEITLQGAAAHVALAHPRRCDLGAGKHQDEQHRVRRIEIHHLRQHHRVQHLPSEGSHRPTLFLPARESVGSRHNEFYAQCRRPEQDPLGLPLEHLHANIPDSACRKADPSGTNFRNFGDKYGATKYDDLESISGQMVDYIRNQNLADGYLRIQSVRHERLWPGHAGLLCGGTDACIATWFIASSPLPKGSGRFLTISEVALVVGLRAKNGRG